MSTGYRSLECELDCKYDKTRIFLCISHENAARVNEYQTSSLTYIQQAMEMSLLHYSIKETHEGKFRIKI